jgi:hypothetical protein
MSYFLQPQVVVLGTIVCFESLIAHHMRHLNQHVRRKRLLRGQVHPLSAAARRVVHARAHVARPVQALWHAVIEGNPTIISVEIRQDTAQALQIIADLVAQPLGPCKQRWIDGLLAAFGPMIRAIRADLATDETILVLLAVKVVQRRPDREHVSAVASKRCDGTRIPLKDIFTKGRVETVCSKSVLRRAMLDLLNQEPPGQPVQVNPL